MSIAKKHIDRFNSLHGKRVHKLTLSQFHAEVKKANDPDLKELEQKLTKAISQMNGKPVIFYVSKKLEVPVKKMKVVNAPVAKRETKRSLPPVKRDVSNQVTKEPSKKSAVHGSGNALPVPSAAKKNKIVSLNGVVDASQIAKMNFTKLPISGEYKEVFGALYSDTQIMIWGPPGGGKTVWLLKFAQYLSDKLAMQVLYMANEEMNRSTFTEKVRDFKIGNKNLKFAKDMDSLKVSGYKITDFDVVLFDSVQSLGMDLPAYKKFVKENPGRMYVLIIQSTKEGDFRGGKDWEHEVDIAGEVVNRKLILRKNRLDQNFAKKRETQMINEMVEENKTKKLIKDKVNNVKQVPTPKPDTVTV